MFPPWKLPFWFNVCCEAVHLRHAKHNDPASYYYYYYYYFYYY
jgi:hypothetical protein